MKFKVGDIVKAIDNDYGITNLDNGWVGIVTKVFEHCFNAKTLFCNDNRVSSFDILECQHFELIDESLEDVAHKAILNFIDYNKELFKNFDVNFTITPKPQILDEAEKRYLSNVIRPFRDRVIYITKVDNKTYEYIHILLMSIKKTSSGNEVIYLPYFKANTMYKGMKVYKEYTLEELGL